MKSPISKVVIVSREEFTARRRALAFEKSVAEMASDPAILRECQTIADEIAGMEADGLKHDWEFGGIRG